jgi:hypothetical protein
MLVGEAGRVEVVGGEYITVTTCTDGGGGVEAIGVSEDVGVVGATGLSEDVGVSVLGEDVGVSVLDDGGS